MKTKNYAKFTFSKENREIKIKKIRISNIIKGWKINQKIINLVKSHNY